MRNKDYRELQISSSSLIFIFLSIILLGIIIFLLGVSVGKKQTRLSFAAQGPGQGSIEKLEEPKTIPAEESQDPIQEEIASHKTTQDKPAAQPEKVSAKPVSKPKAPPAQPQAAGNMFYIQVGAYQNKDGALEHAAKLKGMGFTSVVHDPRPNDRRRLFKVRVGGFRTRGEAEQALARVARSEQKQTGDYFIVQY